MEFNATEHPISWFKTEYSNGTLKLKPPYQRNPVWVPSQKCYLIESILLGLPVPEIFIQTETSSEGKTLHWIVDGQQRVRTVLQFVGAEDDPVEIEYNKFILDKLDAGSQWANRAFTDLSEDQKTAFFEYKFAVRNLKTDSEETIRDVFRRLNKNLTALNHQELRNARFTGPFYKMIMDLSNDDYWADNRIVSTSQIRRMKDYEFISNLVIGVMHGPQGGSGRLVDEYYTQYEDYEDEFPGQRLTRKLFRDSLSIATTVLPTIKEGRWGNMTDFYTLFVAIASLLREGSFKKTSARKMRKALRAFGSLIGRRLTDERKSDKEDVIQYARAVEKGANDKKRRADRHEVLVRVIEEFFTKKAVKT